MNRFLLVGLNHTTAPLAVREKLAFAGEHRRTALQGFRGRFAEAEAVLLSTCNRVELYVARGVHGHPRKDEMIDFLASYHSIPPLEIAPHFYHKADREAVLHLFSVAASLNSMVLGETQILGQVRDAYDLARGIEAAGPMLNPLFQRAIAVGKQIMTQTTIGEGRLSVASIAVDYARQIFDHFHDKTVLTIGAGKMTTLVLQNFQALCPGRLLVCNRDPNKAVALADRFGGTPAPYEQLTDHLIASDIVITSTGATDPIITRRQFQEVIRRRRYRPVFLIDIALPRDVEEAVGDIEDVYLYNIDDLQQVVASTQIQRAAAVAEASKIVEREVNAFAAWYRAREMGPLIERLYKRYQGMAMDEVARTVNKLNGISAEEKVHLEELARRIVNKLLHDPIHTLRHSEGFHGPNLRTLERLFGLSDGTEEEDSRKEEEQGRGGEKEQTV